MKDIVSFETAKALKEAGFPQPMLEAGQFWYEDDVHIKVINSDTGAETFFFEGEEIFAPGAGDILRELGPGFALCISNKDTEIFLCYSEDVSEIDYFSTQNKNSAEACAAAWLYITLVTPPKK